ncbi:hypothetical protein G9C85_15275 [Halorubellus sp. JP-L1]|uniref:hypothetical protein n=1 Tax=Halorubellus sp. JP-L1 TaxID=2715753 RepID=UPI00140BED7A|nr:hypothetical protein [Halorubellus sp. JP-L1]NHN42981.1 hypothetical protein [Halorubellus sp. JP-L1]
MGSNSGNLSASIGSIIELKPLLTSALLGLFIFLAQSPRISKFFDSLGGGIGVGSYIIVLPLLMIIPAAIAAYKQYSLISCCIISSGPILGASTALIVYGMPIEGTSSILSLGVSILIGILVGAATYSGVIVVKRLS